VEGLLSEIDLQDPAWNALIRPLTGLLEFVELHRWGLHVVVVNKDSKSWISHGSTEHPDFSENPSRHFGE
jgi:hypothetical protein